MKELDLLTEVLQSDFTDNHLAEIAGMSQQAISKYRNGLSKIENMRVVSALRLIKYWEEIGEKRNKLI